MDKRSCPLSRSATEEAKEAVRGPQFEGLLQVLERSAGEGTSREWSAQEFAQAGCFGPFLSLLALIERDDTGEETGGSVVTYRDISPPASRTRSQQARQNALETPTKKSYSVTDLFANMGFTPGTSESLEEPPSGQGLVGKFEQARVNVQDEQTVNQCLINLMLPITWHLGISGNIDPHRRAFTFLLDGSKAYEARVDGIVRSPTRRTDIVGILEAKKGHRTDEVRLQELAQMVAFINALSVDQDDDTWVVKRRWLVSMCANELFITIATCKRPYLEFLAMREGSRGDMPELKEDNFLHMREHGPYKLKYHSHLVAALEHLYVLLSNP